MTIKQKANIKNQEKKLAKYVHGDEEYTVNEVALHNRADDAWIIVESRVYDITKFIDNHPGGAEILLDYLGQDISAVISSADPHHHSRVAYDLLGDFYIGMVKEAKSNSKDNAVSDSNYNFYLNKLNEEDIIDWSKPLVPQVGKLGDLYEKWVFSPVDKQLRLFHSDILEFFSYCPWYVVPMFWLPVAAYVAHYALIERYGISYSDNLVNTQSLFVLFLFVVGFMLWSIPEYILHRIILHTVPSPNWPSLVTLHFLLHGQHHKVPFGGLRLVFSPFSAVFFVIPTYLIFAAFGPIGKLMFVGSLVGYVLDDIAHWYLHEGTPSQGTHWQSMKTYHVAHHYLNRYKGFGISNKLFDKLFNTYPPRA